MTADVERLSRSEATCTAISVAASVQGAVVAVRDAYRLDHVTYHHGHIFRQGVDETYVRSTYSDAWLARYLLKGYIRVDPVVREGFARMLPFDWRQLALTQAARALMEDAAAHGLVGNGYSIPLIDNHARRAVFSITSAMPLEDWDAFIARSAADLAEIAFQLHAMAVREIYEQAEPTPVLTARELECLSWAAQGKEARDTAIILGISSNTVEKYLKTARFRLSSSSTTQAVAKAISLGLIRS